MPLPAPHYEDSHCTLYRGDALELLRELAPRSLAGILTDPPYSSGGAFRSDRTQTTQTKYITTGAAHKQPDFTGDNRDQRSFLAWMTMWTTAAQLATATGGALLTFTDWRQLPTMTDAIQCGGWIWKNLLTWHKPNIRNQRGRFSLSAEYILAAANGPLLEAATSPPNVFTHRPVAATNKAHIAEKPLPVLHWLLSGLPHIADRPLLDPFAGSGTTLRACKDAGRSAIGFEIDPYWCDVCAARLEQQTLGLDLTATAAANHQPDFFPAEPYQ